MFVEVALPLPMRRLFTYRLPLTMTERALAGCRVTVPLGRKVLTGFIVSLSEHAGDEVSGAEIKEVLELLDEEPLITPEILQLTRWLSDYYYASWGECLRTALPSGATVTSQRFVAITASGLAELEGLRTTGNPRSEYQLLEMLAESGTITVREIERTISSASALISRLEREGLIRTGQHLAQSRFKPRLQNLVRLVCDTPGSSRSRDTESVADTGTKRRGVRKPVSGSQHTTRPQTPQGNRVIELLSSVSRPLPLSELLDNAEVSPSVVRTLEKRGVVEIFPGHVRRDPLAHLELKKAVEIVLTAEQQKALDEVRAPLGKHEYAAFLLHGVTGSGKTEIYLMAMREAVNRGMTALMLVPEISLTPMFARKLRAAFGRLVAILHSNLSEGERIDEWQRVRDGEARVVIGTRSAVFAPLDNLGIVIVDEEHDSSYKQEEAPRYNGRDTAIMRASLAGAAVVLGSATPSVESFHNAHTGKYEYLRLATRYGDRKLADVHPVDMREVFKRHGKQQILSDELKQAIAETLDRREQAIVLLNRRGFSAFLLCRSCGQAIYCPNCDVTLTYHRFNSSLLCHYCNYIRPVPRACPTCEGEYIYYIGEGTEKLHAHLEKLFPRANIARVDRDTTRKRGSLERLVMEFAAGTIDILAGTQILAKGHDFPNVTLVGVVSVDIGLGLPDFRSAERTFQLLTQVAGRAGRGDRPGKVLIQSYHPEHYALVSAAAQDYDEFYRHEIDFRRTMHYPPFSALINVRVQDKSIETASAAAADMARELRAAARDRPMRILGPAQAPIARLKSQHRLQILIKTRSRKIAREVLEIAMDRVENAGHNPRLFTVEVDPLNLM